MTASKYLIDTNVFIGLEDASEVAPNFASLQQLASTHNVGIFVHAAAIDDINRDKDIRRRRISLSKVQKFPAIAKVRGLSRATLAKEFGSLPRPNDEVDATLLHSLKIGVADFVVTEDRGLHERARRYSPGLADRVLYVADAVSLLRSTYEPIGVDLPYVEEVEAHTIPPDDPIFDSLRDGYPEFDNWWREKCVRPMRKCWVVIDEGTLAGLVVRKDETHSDTDATLPGNKILKICTFKVRPERRGIKLGELLLKQVLWFAQANHYDVAYVTTYPSQETLIDLLQFYGFSHTSTKDDGELVYEKPFASATLSRNHEKNLFELDRENYPRFYTGADVSCCVIPIREEFHEVLFPELADRSQLELFGTQKPATPGNTIRKVYLCRAPAWIEQSGAVLLFYKGKSSKPPSQAITTVGIFEDMTLANSTEELRRLAGGRSVYSDVQLQAFAASAARPVKVINFLLAGHLNPPMTLAALNRCRVFGGHPPQSISRLKHAQMKLVLEAGNLGFAI